MITVSGGALRPGQSRLDELTTTAKIVKSIVPTMMANGFNGIFLVATNPCDIITWQVWQLSGLPRSQVLGTGVWLDTTRLRRLLAQELDIGAQSIDAFILGEHGDTQFPVWSHSSVYGTPIADLYQQRTGLPLDREAMADKVRKLGFEIYAGKGCTEYGVAGTIAEICRNIFTGSHRALAVSCILDGEYGFFKDYYDMVLNQEKDGVCRKYTDLKTEGLHYSAAFSGGDVAMMNMGSWFIATLISNLKSGEYDSSLCGNWGIVKYPHAEGVEPGSTLGTITGLAVTTATDTPDAAWEFGKWVSGEEGAKVMAETGNFPAIMTDDAMNIITSLDGFPQDEASKEALTVSNLYLEVPYAENVSEINSALDSYHGSIMSGEMTVDEGIAAMEEAVKAIKNK